MALQNLIIKAAVESLVQSNFQKIIGYLNSKMFYSINVDKKNPYFTLISDWLQEERISNLRNVYIDYKRSQEGGYELVKTYGPGTFWIRLSGKHMIFHLTGKAEDENESSQKKKAGHNNVKKQYDTIKIVFLSFTPQEDENNLFLEVNRIFRKRQNDIAFSDKIRIYKNDSWHWYLVGESRIRPVESLVYSEDVTKPLFDDLSEFYGRKQWYYDLNIPYQRGYLFYGPPGNGKTSLIKAIAGHYKKSIYYFTYVSGMDDTVFADLIEKIPHEDSIIVIEDIDSLLDKRNLDRKKELEEDEDESGPTKESGPSNKISFTQMTLSGFLNCIDGIMAPDGRVIFVTTNNVDAIDDAVLRPGRLDFKIEIKNAIKVQASKMIDRFFPELDVNLKKKFVEQYNNETASMASLQEFFTRNLSTPDNILNMPKEWKE